MSYRTPLSALAKSRKWQANFLVILPIVEHHARYCFRRLHAEARQEAIIATIARAFVDYGELARQRKLAQVYPSSLADYAVRRVRARRAVGSRQNTRDLLEREDVHVQSMTPFNSDSRTWRELVLNDRRTTPADQAAFNIDFQAWLAQWPPRHRAIIYTLAVGERTSDVAARFRISRARISQLRRRYEQSWEQFQGADRAAWQINGPLNSFVSQPV